MPNVVVYVKADDWKRLQEEGAEPKTWVKTLVAKALERKREEQTTSK